MDRLPAMTTAGAVQHRATEERKDEAEERDAMTIPKDRMMAHRFLGGDLGESARSLA